MLRLRQTIYRSFGPRIQRAFKYLQTRGIPKQEIIEGRYLTRFARTPEEIDQALRLRFEVFNLELNEGLESSFITGRDEDEFDQFCHHLIVIERSSNRVVGTYRLQTFEMVRDAFGFYSASEFQIEKLPVDLLKQSIEIGRACIAKDHRNNRVLFLLWKGLALYLMLKKKRYMFGCCSLPSQNPIDGITTFEYLNNEKHLHPHIKIQPRVGYQCKTDSPYNAEAIELPKLFKTYLRIGAKVCSEPALDRHFKTIDFFVLFDVNNIEPKYYEMFFREFEYLRKDKERFGKFQRLLI
ncbi:MAG: GNAT family N-acetyltransferase [Acidobacteria bacterium]|nr:MAG: GNAT family N-acetyltransferase [Acidobacteriota bacterium]